MSKKGENIRMRKDGRWEGRYTVHLLDEQRSVVHSVYGGNYDEVREKLFLAKRHNSYVFHETVCAGAADMTEGVNGKTILSVNERILPSVNERTIPSVNERTIHAGRNEEEALIHFVPFADLADDWFQSIAETIKISTYTKYRGIYLKYLEPILGGHNPSLISSEYFQELVIYSAREQNRKKGISESLEKSIYSVANQILGYASEQYHIDVTYLVRRKSKRVKKPIKTFNITEQQRLLRYLYRDMDVYKMGVIVCLYTGLRLGELCSLKWSDIDMENRIIHVNSTVQRLPVYHEGTVDKTELIETSPKSYCSIREIPVADDLYRLLQEYCHKGKYLIEENVPMDPRSYQKKFTRYLQEAEIPHKGFHALRHTFATNCATNGTDIKSLSEILGHSDVKITLNSYVHPSMEIKRAFLNQLSGQG